MSGWLLPQSRNGYADKLSMHFLCRQIELGLVILQLHPFFNCVFFMQKCNADQVWYLIEALCQDFNRIKIDIEMDTHIANISRL